MKMHRIMVAGYDKSANSEMAKLLSQNSSALVTFDDEFQKSIETGDKYKWLSILINLEDFYHQSLLILWFGNNKRKKLDLDINNQRIVNYCNELLFQPYSNPKLNEINTRIYFVNIAQKVRFNDLAITIRDEMDKGTIPYFTTDSADFLWSFPFDIIELKN